MRQLSDAERRARTAEDLVLESPSLGSILLGVSSALAWAAAGIALVNMLLDAPAVSPVFLVSGLFVGALAVYLPLLLRKRREQWIVTNGDYVPGRIVGSTLVGMASSGAGFTRKDNYPVVRAEIAFADRSNRQRRAWVKRTVHSVKHRDLRELENRALHVYWHVRFPSQAVAEDAYL